MGQRIDANGLSFSLGHGTDSILLFDRDAKLRLPKIAFDGHIKLVKRVLHDTVRIKRVYFSLCRCNGPEQDEHPKVR
jgi:hypothetical protein